jgi:hydroxymethylpyrimidine/phosphomethylpyrimidine kinase
MTHSETARPGPINVLLISGLDPSGGAGFIADLRMVGKLGCRPAGVITALTEQNTAHLSASHPVDAAILSDQLSTLLTDISFDAIKIGMVGNLESVRAIADALNLSAAPVVWDPVMRPTRGNVDLFTGDFAAALAMLAPHLTLLTPNADEAAQLTGLPVTTRQEAIAAAEVLHGRGIPAVLVKGGHLTEGCDDVLVSVAGITVLPGERVALAQPVHGTGCVLSTSITCALAKGHDLGAACLAAKALVAERLRSPAWVGRGRPSML